MMWEELVGPTLLTCDNVEVSTTEALKDKKYVMLYFSAHWCPPCRKFTPVLATAYNAHDLSSRDGNTDDNAAAAAAATTADEIEVIFISLDSVKSEYDEYRNTMPWLSVPFANLHKLRIKDELSTKFAIRGIPALIVLDGATAEVVTTNGRANYHKYFKGETASASSCIVS